MENKGEDLVSTFQAGVSCGIGLGEKGSAVRVGAGAGFGS